MEIFYISNLIRFTLLWLYVGLTIPLIFLAPGDMVFMMFALFIVGLVFFYGLLAERVTADEKFLASEHPKWISWLLCRNWKIKWDTLIKIIPIKTSQGANIYYLQSKDLDCKLLPQRVQNFEKLLSIINIKSGINIDKVSILSPLWTYQVLAVLTILILFVDALIFYKIIF